VKVPVRNSGGARQTGGDHIPGTLFRQKSENILLFHTGRLTEVLPEESKAARNQVFVSSGRGEVSSLMGRGFCLEDGSLKRTLQSMKGMNSASGGDDEIIRG